MEQCVPTVQGHGRMRKIAQRSFVIRSDALVLITQRTLWTKIKILNELCDSEWWTCHAHSSNSCVSEWWAVWFGVMNYHTHSTNCCDSEWWTYQNHSTNTCDSEWKQKLTKINKITCGVSSLHPRALVVVAVISWTTCLMAKVNLLNDRLFCLNSLFKTLRMISEDSVPEFDFELGACVARNHRIAMIAWLSSQDVWHSLVLGNAKHALLRTAHGLGHYEYHAAVSSDALRAQLRCAP